MIERFNFYDVYGYLIPGLVLVALLWLPFGLVDQAVTRLEFSSAVFALVLGYIAGHLLQGLAITAFPSDRPRFPSDFLLDDNDPTFSPELKGRLFGRILEQFGIDVASSAGIDAEVLKRRRLDAFMLCRRSLIEKEVASYAEQFEGMYALMRGVAAACILALGYNIGFLTQAVLHFQADWGRGLLAAVLLVLLVAAITVAFSTNLANPKQKAAVNGKLDMLWRKLQPRLFWLVFVVLYLFGTLATGNIAEAFRSPVFLLILTFVLLFVAARSHGAYRQFSRRFAETVYRDFCAHDAK